MCCGPQKKLQVSAMATQKSLQKCHQFAVMGEREPFKNQTLGHQIENKRMNKTLSRFLCTSSNEQQAIYVSSSSSCCHIVFLHGSDFAFIFFHPCCCFCFCSWVLVLLTSVKRQKESASLEYDIHRCDCTSFYRCFFSLDFQN